MIRESHIDTMGHVNNATYLEIFEDARWDLITSRGYGLKEVHERKITPVILEIDIKFKKELRNRENVRITTECLSYEGKIGKLLQIMYNEKGDEACTASMVIGLFDLSTRRLIAPTPEWRKAIGLDL